jgi:Tol biopolymer transport system component
MGNSWSRHARALVLLVLAVGVAGGSASASPSRSTAFPGANGLIAFNSEGAIFVVNPDGSGLRRLAQTNSSDYTTGVSWSADGRQLAFSAYRGSDPDIYIVQANGRRLRQVTFSRGIDVDPSWSPDGKHIAFETNRNGNVDIYSIDSTGRNSKRLTSGAENEQDPSWSPDGTKIAYTVEATDGSTREVWVMNADGTNQTQLTSAPNFSENPNWLPDGSRIAFDSDRLEKGDLDVYSMRADGTDVKRLTTTPALDALPAYSPDGKQIVFVSDRIQKDSRRLFVLPAAGGRARRLIAGDEPGFQMVPDWQRIRPGTKERPAVPPGAPLGARGVADSVDPLYDQDDAWSLAMTAGVTYRFNLQPRGGCASAALYPPGTRAFAGTRSLVSRACGGYFTYTPGPGRDGTYTVLVSARPGTETIVPYRLAAAPAEPDDQGRDRHRERCERVGERLEPQPGRRRPVPLRCHRPQHRPHRARAERLAVPRARDVVGQDDRPRRPWKRNRRDARARHLPDCRVGPGASVRELPALAARTRGDADDPEGRDREVGDDRARPVGRAAVGDDTAACRRACRAPPRLRGSARGLGVPAAVDGRAAGERHVHATRCRCLARRRELFRDADIEPQPVRVRDHRREVAAMTRGALANRRVGRRPASVPARQTARPVLDDASLRSIEERFRRDAPLPGGWHWRATHFAEGWARIAPDPPVAETYLGGYVLVCWDGTAVELSANPFVHGPEVAQAVIAHAPPGATAQEIRRTIEARTAAVWQRRTHST